MCLLITGAADSLFVSRKLLRRYRKMLGKGGWGNSVFPWPGFWQNMPGDCLCHPDHHVGASLGFVFCCHPAVTWWVQSQPRWIKTLNTGFQTHTTKWGPQRIKWAGSSFFLGVQLTELSCSPTDEWSWVFLVFFRISRTGRSIERHAPPHRGFTLHVASLFQTPQYTASFLSRRNISCRNVPWRLKGGGIKPVVDGSGILNCISSAFIETCVYRVCVCVRARVCLLACVWLCVCVSLAEGGREWSRSRRNAWAFM